MNLSAKTEYAAIALLDLAAHWQSSEPLRIRDIAERHGIPQRFLVQILLQLKGAGLVHSARGAAGGYYLARAPEEISLADVASAMEGRLGEITSNLPEATPQVAVLHRVWRSAAQAEFDALASVSFAELVERLSQDQHEMYYI
jgi:Rrf2 family protein